MKNNFSKSRLSEMCPVLVLVCRSQWVLAMMGSAVISPHRLGAIFPPPVPSPPSRISSEADGFEFGTQDLQTAWRTPTMKNISGYGRFQGSHWGARPCTFSSLDTSAPFSFLAPCCHVCTGLGQEKKEAKSCFYSRTLLPCPRKQGRFVIRCG